MPEPGIAEVVPKVIVKERLPTAPAVGSAEALAKSIDQKLIEGDWRGGLELGARQSIEAKKISDKLDQIGIERDPSTGQKKRSTEEEARYREASREAAFAKRHLDVGYDGLSAVEQNELRRMIFRGSNLIPAIASEVASMTNSQKKAFAERILKDPKLSQEARQIFEELLNPENRLIDVSATQEAKLKTDDDLAGAEAEKADHDRFWSINDKRLAEFEERINPVGGAAIKGPKLAQLESLSSSIQVGQGNLDAARLSLQAAQNEVRKFQNEKNNPSPLAQRPAGAIEADFNRAMQQEAIARKTYTDIEEKLAKLQGEQQSLREENQQLMDRQKTLDMERRTIERKIRDAEREAIKRQWELNDQLFVRKAQEQDMVDGFRNIISEATQRYIDKQVEQATEMFKQEIEVLKQKTTDQNEKAMYDALQNRWIATRTRRRGIIARRTETYRPLDKTAINADFANLMTEGPERTMRDLLMSRSNPATGTNYTEAEANEILGNKEYVAKTQPEVVKQLLARKLLVGGISEEDIHIITNSQWGQGMIQGALEKNREFRKLVEEDLGKDSIGSKGFGERFRDNAGKKKLWIFALLGLLTLPAILAVMSAKKESIAA